MIFQVIDVLMNQLLIIKRMIVEISIRSKAFDVGLGAILLMNTQNDTDFRVNLRPLNSRHETETFDRNMKETFWQCFGAYLNIVKAIKKKKKTEQVFNLVAEIFIKDELW